jgi:pyrroloquinoline quinone (PQQ) biosynthesis protein C
MEAAMKKIEKKHSVKFKTGRASYNKEQFSMKVEFLDVKANGTVADSKEVEAWNFYAERHGLKKSLLNSTITLQSKKFKVSGWNTRAKRYPVMAIEVATGKSFKLPVSSVLRAM